MDTRSFKSPTHIHYIMIIAQQGEDAKGTDVDLSTYKGKALLIVNPNVNALEMGLGAYFAQVEGTLNKLSTMGVLLGSANLFVSVAIVIMGIFGMSIKIALFRTTQTQFLEVVIGSIGGLMGKCDGYFGY
ncbi:hypothetical protein Syun_016660 [Stephania yunnanensis]|uniref:Uncharacterized protein n=1 Tax=Stephania yunnanensis TaxID=152371 RepID=A0AAP0J7R5_9MAGN